MWRGAGATPRATGALWALAVTAALVAAPVVVAIWLPQHLALGVAATGDDFGLLPSGADSLAGRQGNTYAETGYLADASAHASLAATQKDATTTIRASARQVELCVANIQGWVMSLDRQATSWLANPAQPQLGQSLVSLAREAYLGQGATNGGANGGAEAAFHDGQQMATLPLSARA